MALSVSLQRLPRYGILTVVLSFIGIGLNPARAQDQSVKDEIGKAWKRRQEWVKTARFQWTREQTDAAGSISRIYRSFDPKFTDVIPPRATTFTFPCTALVDGPKLRYEYTTQHWYKKAKGYAPTTYLSTFDGDVCSVLHGPTPEREWHQGEILIERQHVDRANLHLQPILLCYRGLTPGMPGYNPANFDVSGVRPMVGKRVCIELIQQVSSQVENRLWLDPVRNYVVTRFMQLARGVILAQLDVDYRSTESDGWVPDKWSLVYNAPDGSLEKAVRAKLLWYELNASIPSEQFQIEFPPGTRVIDEKHKRKWLVTPDGQGKRTIAPSEDRLPHSELLKSDGQIEGSSFESAKWLVFVGLALAAAALFVAFSKRRHTLFQRRTP